MVYPTPAEFNAIIESLKSLVSKIDAYVTLLTKVALAVPAAPAPGLPGVTISLPTADDVGTATGGDSTTLIDSTKYWPDLGPATLYMLIANQLYVTSISANTTDRLTFPALPGGVKPEAGTPYAIKRIGLTAYAKVATKIIDLSSLAAGATSALTDCTAINLKVGPTALALTIACTFDALATQGIKVHVRSSYDGTNYDTQDFDAWTPNFTAGASIRVTKVYDVSPAYIKVLVENLDPAKAVTAVSVNSTVRGG